MKKIISLVIVWLSIGAVHAQSSLKINESETRAFFEASRLQVNLATENSRKDFRASVRLEILDSSDRVVAQKISVETIRRGRNFLPASVSLTEKFNIREMLWHRLRYQVAGDQSNESGIVSLSEIMPELFEMRISASNEIYAGMRFPVRVRAFHPIKGVAVSGVKVRAELKIDLETEDDDDELKIKAAGETESDGFALLEFEIPAETKISGNWGGEIEVTGEKNGLVSQAGTDLRTDANRISVFFLTDKPLYQPNQKLYARGLVLRSGISDAGMTVAAEKELEFSIKDEAHTIVYRQTVKTSRFGIAAIEWQIPESAKLGTYKIQVKADETLVNSEASFKVSRYDLPNFVVRTKSNKDFYLPGETTAEVTIDALYLFGKPVTAGKVRVVQEGRRRWDFSEQKWSVQEEAVYEGETDADGKYVARIDLSGAHEILKYGATAFQDLNFAAYFTDPATNKTEQRRFDLRVTKEPIHVYLTKAKGGQHNPKLPLTLYVSTYSADGKPLACEAEIRGKYGDEKEEQTKPLAKIKTNAFGAGKVEFFAPKFADGRKSKNLELKIVARDAENHTGTKTAGFAINEDAKQILLRTDKAIYRPGEPVRIEILSSETSETVLLNVSKKLSSLASRQIKLKNGRAALKISSNGNFKNNLTISAFFDDDGQAVLDSRGIVFPMPRSLRVEAVSNKSTYRPNEEATVNFAVSEPGKNPSESALGIVVLDKAVEERAKTDADFGATNIFHNFGSLLPQHFDELDLKKPISSEIQLSAEMAFQHSADKPNFFGSGYSKNLRDVFVESNGKQLESVIRTLHKHFNDNFVHPTDETSMRKILNSYLVNFDDLRDPWGTAYQVNFTVQTRYDVVEIKSAGPNKIPGDSDDFAAQVFYFEYFKPTAAKIEKAVAEYFQKTGKIVRDEASLREALKAHNINLDEIRDRWGEPYRVNFGMNERYSTFSFLSGGADRKFGNNLYYDDFWIWSHGFDYWSETERKIGKILDRYASEKKTFPQNEAEFKALLKAGGIDFDSLRDGWDRPFYIESEIIARAASRLKMETALKASDGKPEETFVISPVAQRIAMFRVRSLGADGVKDKSYYADPQVSVFGGLVSEQVKEEKPKLTLSKSETADGKSVIYGVVKDRNDALVANANVTVYSYQTQKTHEVKTNAEGMFVLTKLGAGNYMVRAGGDGFKTSVINSFYLAAGKMGEANLTLETGNISETVFITLPGEITIDTTDSRINAAITTRTIQELPLNGRRFSSLLSLAPGVRTESLADGFRIDGASATESVFIVGGQEVTNFRSGTLNEDDDLPAEKPNSTPRLREYFPETLVWQPELITDQNGNASLKFRLADNITTWKLYAIASDSKGKVGVTTKEIRAFQPFFVDLEPPRVLTEGDEIHLPVQIRNYTKEKQTVDIEMAQSDWFTLLGEGKRQIEVAPNTSQNAIFGFRAEKAIDGGKQKVTAIAETASDAIEKPVVVKPNGREIVRTQSETFNQSVKMHINFPDNALPNTGRAELKIYPNLFSHVTESVEGLLRRPYGCGEQTISSTYPNLMVLKFTKTDASIRQAARKFLKKGYERLLGYKAAGGGFSYWGKGDPDAALTVYAYRFLTDAREHTAVDENVLTETRDWLIGKQSVDGGFEANLMQTAYFARTLARNGRDEKSNTALKKALNFLKEKTADSKDVYTLALYGLASLDAGDVERANEIGRKLEKLAVEENGAVFWKLEGSTPFYGWGNTGQIETTALALQLLVKLEAKNNAGSAEAADVIPKATVFLLKSKDRHGVWYSTQTTINVLDAFLAAMPDDKNARGRSLQISLNGAPLENVEIAADQIAPIIVNLNGKLSRTANRVEIRSAGISPLTAQLVASHYIDWNDANLSTDPRQMRLDYSCDRTEASVMQEINCTVEAERTAFNGYGMLLAEIGIPPGADVSRESLQKAMEADRSLSRYEVLPDRIIVYLWAKPGGTQFSFKFKPRYGINARTPASFVYDYYNEEAKATVAPLKFSVN